jgi:hypothetical protein
MAEVNFNYTDNLQSNAYTQFIADQHDKAVETTGRKTYVFKLDKVETKLSEVYQEETNGRIYLPYFEQRGIYKTNNFVSQLGVKNFTETEENLEIEYDFGRMVHIISELKKNTAGKLTIKNISSEPLEIEINDKKLIVRNFRQILYEVNLDNKIYKFVNTVNKQNLINLTYSGDNEMAVFTDKIMIKLKPRREYELNMNNSIYKNVSDVITHGDAIVTDRGRAYQVVGAYPRNDIYGRYINWNVQCELINLAKLDGMPSEFVEFIKNNQYGFLNKYDLR